MTLNILIIEDNDINRRFMYDLVRAAHHHAFIAEKFDHAKEILATEKIDLVLCDHMLDDVQGFQIVDYIRAQFPTMVIWIISGIESEFVEKKYHKMGIPIIRKPFDISEFFVLLAGVDQACQHASS